MSKSLKRKNLTDHSIIISKIKELQEDNDTPESIGALTSLKELK